MENLIRLFIEQKLEKRVFASFGGSTKEKKFTDDDIKKMLEEPEMKIIIESGADLEKLKEMYFAAFDKAFDKLKKKQEGHFQKILAYLRKNHKFA